LTGGAGLTRVRRFATSGFKKIDVANRDTLIYYADCKNAVANRITNKECGSKSLSADKTGASLGKIFRFKSQK